MKLLLMLKLFQNLKQEYSTESNNFSKCKESHMPSSIKKRRCLEFLHIKYISSIYSLTQRNRFWSMSCYTSCSVRTHKEKGSTQSLGPIEYIHCRKA